MICNIITEKPPETVNIGGTEYPINWDFRVGIQFDGLKVSGMREEDKFVKILQLYYPKVPVDVLGAINKIKWFYCCGNDIQEEDNKQRRYQRRDSSKPSHNFSQDAAYIYAAFKEQYGIDLTQIKHMHWWRFMALFESLGEDTQMWKIMYYRRVSTSGMTKDRRAFINEMKKMYEIRDGSAAKMTLEQRNQKWKDYIEKRYKKESGANWQATGQ